MGDPEMTSTLPSGEGTPDGAEPDGALEPDSAPATGLEPDTAPGAAGEQHTSSAADGSAAPDPAVDGAPEHGDEPSESGEEPGPRLLGDPGLDNEQEMQQARADLQSSREKSSTARDCLLYTSDAADAEDR